MRAMVLARTGERLAMEERPEPAPGPGQVRVRVEACGVCRTDLHVVDGELPDPKLPIVPGHEIVGRVEAAGDGVALAPGTASAWLGSAMLAAIAPIAEARARTCATRRCLPALPATAALPPMRSPTRLSSSHSPRTSIRSRPRRSCAPASSAGARSKWPETGRRSASMASAPRRISSPRSAAGRDGASSPSPGRAMRPVKRSRGRSGPNGRAGRTTRRQRRSTPPFFSRRSARWSPRPSPPCARAGGWSAAAFT